MQYGAIQCIKGPVVASIWLVPLLVVLVVATRRRRPEVSVPPLWQCRPQVIVTTQSFTPISDIVRQVRLREENPEYDFEGEYDDILVVEPTPLYES